MLLLTPPAAFTWQSNPPHEHEFINLPVPPFEPASLGLSPSSKPGIQAQGSRRLSQGPTQPHTAQDEEVVRSVGRANENRPRVLLGAMR